MTDDLWQQYTEGTRNYLAFHRLEYADTALNPVHTSSIQAIETKWTILKKSILASKAQYIPMYNTKATNRNHTPLPIRQKENMILQIHHVLLNFSIKKIIHRMAMENEQHQTITIDNIPPEKWQTYWNIWPLIRKTLYKANTLFDKIIFNYLPLSITQSNYIHTKRIIKQGLLMAKEIKQAAIAKHDITNINLHILNRNNNLENNQRKMINSLLDRKPRHIRLDRLLVPASDNPNEITLSRDPKTIERHSIQHFQLLGSSSKEELTRSIKPYSTLEDIPVEFRPYYAPIQTIDQAQYDCALEEITNDEILATFASLPNHKAPGISGITYEDLKHIHPDIIQYTTDLFNLCLRTSSIPRDWKKALLFPIPKPKEWGSDINNTRPIILLETLRKCFIKILTARLHTVLSQRHFLQPNNRAGLIGESTYQPLQHLHHAIEMAKKYKKEIWIGVQDLSKAYDRINISLLRLAMARLRIPQTIIELILQLFTDRTNRIILYNDNISDPYQVMQGIDQGEVVSPLLWIIYYDPLFARINSLRELAFTVELQQIKNIWNPDTDQKVTYSTTVQSYLDDTTWVAPILTHMKTLLEISNDFYELANIQINKDKYRLLTNNKLYVGKEIELTLGSELTNVKINKKKEGVRILGVYIDAFNSPSPTLKKLRQTVALFSNTLRRKKLTHNRIIYITNKVLMPILEYRNQFQVFTIEQCNFIMAPIKKLFKQSLHLLRSTPDALIHHYLLPLINNFFYNQMYSHIAMTQLLFNTPLLNPIAMTQMLTTQYEFWLPHFPTHDDLTKLESTKLATTFLSKLLIYFNNFNIVFTPVYDTTITGGRTPLLFHIPNITKSDITSLKNKRLIFLDQIISGDSSFLLTLPEIKQLAQKNWKGAPPNWLKKMESTEIWTTTNRRLINPPKELPIQNFLIQTLSVLPNEENQLRNQWYIFWDPKSNTSIYGKGITQINRKDTPSMTQLQHYVQTYLEDDALFNSGTSHSHHGALTPRKKTTILKPCKGCALHTYNVDRPLICTIYIVTSSLCKFKLYNQKIMERKFPSMKKQWKFPTKHHLTLHNIAYNSFLKLHRSSFSHFNLDSNFLKNDMVYNHEFSPQELSRNCNLDKNHFYFLYSLFKGNQHSLDTLYLLIIKFLFRDRLTFYTDGSLSTDGTNKSIMGAAWVEVSSSANDTFQCSTAHLPSSTKAEVLAILTAIIAALTHCHVTIHTDSKNAIDTFNKTGRKNLSQRRIMKLNNFSLWILIHRLIKTKSLCVDMFKVKAHSGHLHNDITDRLAKDACSNPPIFLTISHYSQAPIMVPTLANYGPIDKNIRKYLQRITNLRTFEKLLRTKALSHLFGPTLDRVDMINWELTKDWIAQSCDGSICSATNDRYTGFKIKNLGHILPTVNKQRIYYPKLYPDLPSNCILCNSTAASNSHWGLCHQHHTDRLADYKECLSVLLKALETYKEIAVAPPAQIAVSTSPLSCFDLEHNSSFYILLHNAVPNSLSDLIARFIRSRKTKNLVMNLFLSAFMDNIIRKYWRKYALAYKQWEKSLHITKRDKRLYRKRHNHDNESHSLPGPSLSQKTSLD
ncbi:hypothetical protein RclHR1_06320002 [Rhizophagus clarus]|uniref:Ribonuclease H-like domain-containing protein n=1 Tax=Rhizophagus clarus TaxID=94130 RepID=A0A2Z6RSE5_9GLOM|nr:hypothetical protein RclHR1_06320002 [Rhizophagus clarus]GES93950.1 ribonuclease H-like domain-containing protein [Rhizophagus clarus]